MYYRIKQNITASTKSLTHEAHLGKDGILGKILFSTQKSVNKAFLHT